MKQEVEMSVLQLDEKKYFLMDSIIGKNTYYYFSNTEDANDIMILKEQGDNFISLDNDSEREYALSLFYEKYEGTPSQ